MASMRCRTKPAHTPSSEARPSREAHSSGRTPGPHTPGPRQPGPYPPHSNDQPRLLRALPRSDRPHRGVPPTGHRHRARRVGGLQRRGHLPGLGAQPPGAAAVPRGHGADPHRLSVRLRYRGQGANVRHVRQGRGPGEAHGARHGEPDGRRGLRGQLLRRHLRLLRGRREGWYLCRHRRQPRVCLCRPCEEVEGHEVCGAGPPQDGGECAQSGVRGRRGSREGGIHGA